MGTSACWPRVARRTALKRASSSVTEYRMNALLMGYPKPVCAVMDGIVMGGGVGISLPCAYRVATERTTFAMPETGIGLFPDVGGGWHLPRLPGEAGLWLALTGARIKAADCLLLGIATDYVPSADVEALKAAILADPAAIETILTRTRGRRGQAAHRRASGPDRRRLRRAEAWRRSCWRCTTPAPNGRSPSMTSLLTKSPQTLKVALSPASHRQGADVVRGQHGDGVPHRRPRGGPPTISSKGCVR